MYSQDYEDLILSIMLQGVENGFYVDVGANSPFELSVTKTFYDAGWRGINIEPLKDRFSELCQYRKRDINLNVGAGGEEREMEFYIADMGTTCDSETLNDPRSWLHGSKDKLRKESVLVRRLTDILSENLKADEPIHFCKIDVEGFERSVLEGLDFNRFRPWIFVMEATIPGTSIPCHDRWEDILLGSGYALSCKHGINRYYADTRNGLALSKIEGNVADIAARAAEYDIVRVDFRRVEEPFTQIIRSREDGRAVKFMRRVFRKLSRECAKIADRL
jgi:FkbM family methyltransferase